MEHYAGIDVSMECSSVCVVNASGKIVREAKVASEPEVLHPGAFQPSRASYGAVCSARRAAWLEGRRSSLTLMV